MHSLSFFYHLPSITSIVHFLCQAYILPYFITLVFEPLENLPHLLQLSKVVFRMNEKFATTDKTKEN